MYRRNHRKSKGGCLQCKKRHIKCDETHPRCANCSTSDFSCSFGINAGKTSRAARAFAPSASSSVCFVPDVVQHPRYHPAPAGDFDLNPRHLELFHHFLTVTSYTLCADPNQAKSLGEAIVFHALIQPYLLHEIISFAASHLAALRPLREDIYHHQAAGLQTRALSLFNDSRLEINMENCTPMFLFSCLLGNHSIYNTTVGSSISEQAFLSRYLDYFRVHNGVGVVVSQGWSFLHETDVADILDFKVAIHSNRRGDECAALKTLVSVAEVSESTRTVYREVIDQLQWAFDLEYLHTGITRVRKDLVTGWPVIVPAAYTDLLLQRRPEALIILGHYAVLLHNRRHYWWVGNAGHALLESVTQYLGPHWNKELEWANAVMGSKN